MILITTFFFPWLACAILTSYQKNWENSFSQGKMLCISSILNGFFNFQRVNLEDITSSTFWKEEDPPKIERPRKRKINSIKCLKKKSFSLKILPSNTILRRKKNLGLQKTQNLSQLSTWQAEWWRKKWWVHIKVISNRYSMPSKIVMPKVVTFYMILKLVIYFTFKSIVSFLNVLPY